MAEAQPKDEDTDATASPERGFNRLSIAFQITALALFVAAGFLLVPLLGFEDDELIFVNLFLHPNDAFSRLPLFGNHAIPAMAASYAGALKTWLYSPLLLFAPPTVWVVRVPAVLLGAVVLLLTGRLMKEIAGETACAVAMVLLATDATFLFTATFDWGPVVLQHLLLVTALLLLVHWFRNQNRRLLFVGGVIIGLALWDKSLFVWQLSGLSAAVLLVAFGELRLVWSRRNVWVFTRGLLLGTIPLIIANFRHHFATIRDNGHMSFAEVGLKAAFMRSALDGQAATTFLVDGGIGSIDRIQRPLEALGLALVHSLGSSPSLWRFYPGLAVIVVGILITTGAQRKWVLFLLLSGTVAWFQSAMTRHAGNAVHHSVLVWIDWYGALSLSFAALLRSSFPSLRLATGSIVAVLCARGILVMGANYGELIMHPGTPRWTNADIALCDQLRTSGVKWILAADWGIKNVVRARSEDSIAVDNQGPKLTLGTFDQNAFNSCLTDDCVVVAHAPGRNVFPLAPETLDLNLAKNGWRKVGMTSVYDTHGVPGFEFFHLAK
jgi:4-amino-4-deoxy-L-arabinose transferase-like glycosyltransferase